VHSVRWKAGYWRVFHIDRDAARHTVVQGRNNYQNSEAHPSMDNNCTYSTTVQKRTRTMTDSDDEAVDNKVTSAIAKTEGSQAAATVSTDENEDTQEKPQPKRKRQRRVGQGGTKGEQSLTAVSGLQETAEKSRQERSRQVKPRGARGDAVTKLDAEYPELSGTKLADGYDLFQDAAKAEVFVRMKKGEGQDIWLRRQLRRMREAREDEDMDADSDDSV
jgi:hypothetical protein